MIRVVLALASGHRPRVAKRMLAVWWAQQPCVLRNTSGPHRYGSTMQHYLRSNRNKESYERWARRLLRRTR